MNFNFRVCNKNIPKNMKKKRWKWYKSRWKINKSPLMKNNHQKYKKKSENLEEEKNILNINKKNNEIRSDIINEEKKQK